MENDSQIIQNTIQLVWSKSYLYK